MSATHSPLVLDVQQVRKHFTLHLRDGLQLPVLQGINLQVRAGECVALSGPSGRGKSTLMKCLYGSYAVDAGHMHFHRTDGSQIDLARAPAQAMVRLRRSEIAYVSQFLRALPRVSALDVVCERVLCAHPATAAPEGADPLDNHHDPEALTAVQEQVQALLARLNLPHGLWGLPPSTFSGGEQQRVNIARGFATPARLLLLDEPTASLDAANRRVVMALIEEAKARGSAVVGIFHDEEVRDAVASRVIELGS